MFELTDKRHSQLWIQDGDPSQNCAAAKKKTFQELNAELLSIPARSPDINPIENLFHIGREDLQKEALVLNITHETYEDLSKRVSNTIRSISVECIDSIIYTMEKRMEMITNRKGEELSINAD